VDFLIDLLELFFYGAGGFISWLAKGCKTSLKEEMREHPTRNGIITIVLWVILFGVAVYINN
jgi:hypothetical protein